VTRDAGRGEIVIGYQLSGDQLSVLSERRREGFRVQCSGFSPDT
jgi:hypothetical protein